MAERRCAKFSTEIVGGRTLRVARWNWWKPAPHQRSRLFDGIGGDAAKRPTTLDKAAA